RGRRNNRREFETASTLVLGRARVGQRSKTRYSLLAIRNLSLLLLIVVIAGLLWLTLDDRFYIYHADVVGAVRTSPEEVFRASGLLGLHVMWVRPGEVESRILAELPGLESARVACGLLDDCAITVVERQPRVMWNENGQLWWIDAGGVVFPAPGTLPEGWLIQGPLPREEDGRLDERVRVALTELWSLEADVPQSLYYVPGRGLMFTAERGYRVILGQGPGMAERLQVLACLMTDLEARSLMPQFVDVRFPGAPYYSLTNEW
ncbi:MAG: hypothetical protein DRI77_08985, partial [Chloroflexi bacterium]